MNGPPENNKVTPAVLSGVAALALAAILWFIRPELSILPLAVFVIACLIAPYCPSQGFFLKVVSKAKTNEPIVALTFDDGPDPQTTGPLLDLLDRYGVKAAFFVAGESAVQYAHLIEAILAAGHEIGNHTYHHDPLLMLRGPKKIIREIESTQEALRRFGISPLAFRPPVGITNSVLGGILDKLGLYALNFSCRGCDFGNRRLKGLSGKILNKVKPGDIILMHDRRPPGGSEIHLWLREVEQVLAGLQVKGFRAVPLSDLIGRSVMVKTPNKSL